MPRRIIWLESPPISEPDDMAKPFLDDPEEQEVDEEDESEDDDIFDNDDDNTSW